MAYKPRCENGKKAGEAHNTLRYSWRNTLKSFSLIVVCVSGSLFYAGCPVYDMPYFEFPLTLSRNGFATNIQISGGYVPGPGGKTPVALHIDTAYEFAFIDDAGIVWLNDERSTQLEGKELYALILGGGKVMIPLGRLFNEEPVHLKIDTQGQLEFRGAIANPNDADAPYIPVNSVGELILITQKPGAMSGKYTQTSDINLEGRNWKPVGNLSEPFSGVFDGSGKRLENLRIDRPDESYVGLFGYISTPQAKLMNINITSGSVRGRNAVGSVAGKNERGTVENCFNAAEVRSVAGDAGGIAGQSAGDSTDKAYIQRCSNIGVVLNTSGGTNYGGGIAGTARWTDIRESVNEGDVLGFYYAGGISGVLASGSEIFSCGNTGEVRAADSGGGICAILNGTSAITGSYNGAAVQAAGWDAGGIAAASEFGSITASYSTGDVSGARYVGGVAGLNEKSEISACYSTGTPAGGIFVGGIAGVNAEALSTVEGCYWDNTSLGVGGTLNGAAASNCFQFGADWPPPGAGEAIANWGATYWANLGGATIGAGGVPEYPVLAWQVQ